MVMMALLAAALAGYLGVCLVFRVSTYEIVEKKETAGIVVWVLFLNWVAAQPPLFGPIAALINWVILFSFYGIWTRQIRGRKPNMNIDMRGQVVIVTGSNSGIGTETARNLAAMGATLVMACRTRKTAESAHRDIVASVGGDAAERVHIMDLDLGSLKSVRKFASEFTQKFDKLDVLVNNAGIMLLKRVETVDGFEMSKQVNHMAVQLLTLLLVPSLRKSTMPGGARIVLVGSSSHKLSKKYGGLLIDDLHLEQSYNVVKSYSQSKLALELFRTELCRRLQQHDARIVCNSASPGTVLTNVTRGLPMIIRKLHYMTLRPINKLPTQGAYTSTFVASDPSIAGVSDQWFEHCRPGAQNALARDRDVARRLWDITEKCTGLKAEQVGL